MRSILETFAHGNMSPKSQLFKHNAEYGDAMRALSRNEEKLLEKLNDDEKTIFEKYMDAQEEISQRAAVSNWVDGYKLGLLVTAEVFVAGDG